MNTTRTLSAFRGARIEDCATLEWHGNSGDPNVAALLMEAEARQEQKLEIIRAYTKRQIQR